MISQPNALLRGSARIQSLHCHWYPWAMVITAKDRVVVGRRCVGRRVRRV